MTVAIHNLTDTWNGSGTTFTAIKMNVTDTASAAASLLMDLQVGGSSKLAVDKSGNIKPASSGSASKVIYGFGGLDTVGFWYTSNTIHLNAGSSRRYSLSNTGLLLGSGVSLGWSSHTNNDLAGDLFVRREAANVLSQRNGTTAQEHRWWKTFTDAANGEYGYVSWIEESNVLEIGTKALGTGTQRDISITAGSADIRMPDLPTSNPAVAGALWNNAGVVNVSAG